MSLTLLDWRRCVAGMYAAVRSSREADPAGTLRRFRQAKDRLFRDHPDAPIVAGRVESFEGLRYYPYDPGLSFVGDVEPLPPSVVTAVSIYGDDFPLLRVGRVRLPIGELEIYWIDVYGGGVYVPFRDSTAGSETYGFGRYLLDTAKGADLGGGEYRLVLDFNYAYNPSCAYDTAWSCPLAPSANWLDARINAGEQLPG